MPKGELYINKDKFGQWQDAYELWGLSMTDMGLTALMTPAPNKDYITNESRLEHGKRVSTANAKVASRELSLPVHIKAKTKEEYYQRYLSFCEELKKGDFVIKTKYSNDVYKCVYKRCPQFSQYFQEIAFLTLFLEEPNPCDRSE